MSDPEPDTLYVGDIVTRDGVLRVVSAIYLKTKQYRTHRLQHDSFDCTADGGFAGRYSPRTVPGDWQEMTT